ncbi:MobA/MobL family protein [Fusobacterium sp.]|uniref:MobA/MobL family protein n=1 Tax=Fusobacterium sp. TaxID=68766 RepID=UPI002E77E628|nr:MobA/MobL family protein [Fusobacterium sp.]MEE1476601.1 MobA/MobL family protein [Fusobacterium sp.]
MAIFNIDVQPAKNRSPIQRYDYVLRIGKYSPENNKDKYDDFLYGENINMPSFSQDDPRYFWECNEAYEDVNANLFRTIDFSLPYELSDEENIELATNYAKELFGDKFVYSLAVHSKPSEDPDKRNIHCHIMFYERELDGIERKEECFFKKANSKNPSLGGAKRNREWHKYSKLYYIRQTLESMMNEKLKEKNLELVSCKSLKAQREEAIAEGNFLKAEMLDREPINLKKEYIDYAPDSEEKTKNMNFFQYCKEIKRIKEKEFKLKSENFEEENLKARDRYYQALYEKEGREYTPSYFDVENQNLEKEEENIEENLENIFAKSLDNHILIDRKESRLKQIESMSAKDIESRALNILTQGEYQKNLEKLVELTNLYIKLEDKSKFEYTQQKFDLERYFLGLRENEFFMQKFEKMKENIRDKYSLEKEEILKDLEILRNNPFKNFYISNAIGNAERSRVILTNTLSNIEKLKLQKTEIDSKVKEYKETKLNIDFKEKVYRSLDPEIADKYLGLTIWKKEFEGSRSLEDKLELSKRIKATEYELRIFDLENDIKSKVQEEINTARSEYKELRQTQDDTNGRLSYSYAILKKLKELKEINLVEKEKELQEQSSKLESKLDILEYNIKLSNFRNDYEKAFDKAPEVDDIKVKLSDIEKKEYKKVVQEKIENLKDEIENLKLKLKPENLSNEDIRKQILDEYTNGEYSRDLSVLAYYKTRKENGLVVSIANLKKVESRVEELEKMFTITLEDIELRKQVIREKNVEIKSQISEKSKELSVQFKLLNKLRLNNIRIPNVRRHRSSNYSPKLKVAKSGRIEFDDEKEKRRRGNEWER